MQPAFERLYARHGPPVIFVAYAMCVALGLPVAVLAMASVARYLDSAVSVLGPNIAFMVVTTAPVAAFSVWLSRDALRTPLSWTGDRRTSERAPLVWASLVRLPYVIAGRVFVLGCALMVPFTASCIAVTGGQAWYAVMIPAYGYALATLAVCAVLWTFGIEFAMRPMLRDVASLLPHDFEPTVHAWRLRTKMLVPLPVVTLLGGLTTGAFVDAVPAGTPRLAVAVAIAVATAVVAGSLFLVIVRATLDPIDDLIAATQRVRRGDIATPVPVVTADELGRLAHSFNVMLAELRASQARVVAAADAARRRVERDLHDGAQQRLVLLQLKLGLIASALRRDPAAADALLEEMRGDLNLALAELRDLARGLYPALLEHAGLAEALGEALARSPIPATLHCDALRRLPGELESAVYFCCLEAMQNAAKHAGPGASLRVSLAERDGRLRFEVADDGSGFDDAERLAGAGLQNMRDRIGVLGGELTVASAPGDGTTIRGSVPTQA